MSHNCEKLVFAGLAALFSTFGACPLVGVTAGPVAVQETPIHLDVPARADTDNRSGKASDEEAGEIRTSLIICYAVAPWLGPDTRTPLRAAVQQKEWEKVWQLLEENVLVDLHSAAALGFRESLRGLLSVDPKSLNRTVNGMTPLSAAAEKGQTVVMDDLIGAGADIEAGAPFWTPLAVSVRYGQPEALKMLLDAGAKMPDTPRHATTLLALAMQSGSTRVVVQLINAGALKTASSERAKLGIPFAIYETAELFTRDFRDPAVLGEALYHAAMNGHADVAGLLIDRGADIHATPRSGLATPLHVAAGQGHTAIINLLVARGADVNRKDKQGYTPLDNAFLSKQFASARALEELGAVHGPAWLELSPQSRQRLKPPNWPEARSPVAAE